MASASADGLSYGSFIRQAWNEVRASYESHGIALDPRYSRSIEGLWTRLPEGALRSVVGVNRAMFAHAGVLYQRLCSISREEACGASLLQWASQRASADILDLLIGHARDETRHSKIYLAACDLVRPEAKMARPQAFAVEAEDELGPHAANANVPALLASMHIAEVRNMMNLHLYGQIVDEFRPRYAERFQALLRSIAADELWHVTYTGRLVNQWMSTDDGIRANFDGLVGTYVGYWWGDIDRIAQWFEDEGERTSST
jgi:hypothetical protein